MPERMKWRIAYLLDKLPGQCWADLVGWVYRDRRDDRDWRRDLPWRPQGATCRGDVERIGSCYCGKLRAPEEVPRTPDVIMCRHCEQPIELLVPEGYVNQRWLHVSALGEWDGCGNSDRTVAEPR